MDNTDVTERLHGAIRDGELGRYQEAITTLYELQDIVDPSQWAAIEIGLEQADILYTQGLYGMAQAIAYDCAERTKTPEFTKVETVQHLLLVRSTQVMCFLAAMQSDQMVWPALDGWKLCLDTLLALDRDELDESSYRAYISLETSLCGFAITHYSLRSPEHLEMVAIVRKRHRGVLDWMLKRRLVFPAIHLLRSLCLLDDLWHLQLARWQSLLDRIYDSATIDAIGRIYVEMTEICVQSTWEEKHIMTNKFGVLALAHSLGRSSPVLRLRSRSASIEVAFGKDTMVGASNTHHNFATQLYTCIQYVRLGHYTRAQRGLLKGAYFAAVASHNDYYWIFNAKLDFIDENIGGTRFRILGKLQQIASTAAQGGQVSKVLESLRGLYDSVLAFKVPFISGMHAYACACAYEELGKPNIARFWARECWTWWQRCSEDQASAGAEMYYPMWMQYLARQRVLGNSDAEKELKLQECISKWSAKHASAGRWKQFVETECLLAKCKAYMNQDLAGAYQTLDKAHSMIPDNASLAATFPFRVKILDIRINFKISDPGCSRGDKLKAIMDLQRFVDTPSLGSNMSQQQILLLLNIASKLLDNHAILANGPNDLSLLRISAALSAAALSTLQSSNRLRLCAQVAFVCVESLYLIWNKTKLREDALIASTAVENAEKWFERLRRERSTMSGVMAILSKQALGRDGRLERLAQMAFDLSVVVGVGINPWLRVANAKARSISDSLRMGVKVPQTVLSEIEFFHPEAFAKIQYHSALLDEINGVTKSENRLLLRARSEDVVRQLEENFELGDIQAAITSKKFVEDDLWKAMKLLINLDPDQLPRLNFVDWFVYKGRLTMCLLSGRKPTKFITLNISQSDIQEWRETYLETDYGLEEFLDADPADPEAPLRQLDALVSPLAEYADEDDLLIFMPCRALHGIPLHALHVQLLGGMQAVSLIERYKIVYSASASIFVQCLQRSFVGLPWSEYFDQDASYIRSEYAFIAAYEDELYDADGEEENAINEQIMELADNERDSTCLVGPGSSVQAFQELCTSAKFIHFHGHCKFETRNVLDQALIFKGHEGDTVKGLQASELETNSGAGTEDLVNQLMEVFDKVQIASGNHGPDPERFNRSCKQEWFSGMTLDELALKFATSPEEAEEIASELELSSTASPYELSVRQVFDLNFSAQYGPIVMLIACQSSSQRVGAGDEPLGLETGLLCAGANSVVGTIWKVVSQHARTFSKVFHENFRQQKQENFVDEVEGLAMAGDEESKMKLAMSLIDLADVYRKTVCHLMKDNKTRNFRYWAPFVLTGSPYTLWAESADTHN